jgi:peptidoglycan/LPS O-acetylase OafA/YrhL
MPDAHPPATLIRSHVGLRGIAALTVFLAHMGGMAHVFNAHLYAFLFGWLGLAVDLFFFLSGFVMYWVYVDRPALIDWRGFYFARAARILPLYYLTLIVFLPVPLYSMLQHGLSFVGEGYPHKLLINFLPVSGVTNGWRGTINQPGWSISVELFCYVLLFPALVMVHRGTARIPTMVGGLIAALTVIDVSFWASPDTWVIGGWDGAWLGRGLAGFAAGFFLCPLFKLATNWRQNPVAIDVGLLLALIFFLACRLEWIPATWGLAAFPALVFLTAYDVGVFTSLLKTRPFQWLGERSYSIYLWQFPAITVYLLLSNRVFFHAPQYTYHGGLAGYLHYLGAFVFVMFLSEASYRWFEVPARQWLKAITTGKTRRTPRTQNQIVETISRSR